MPSVDILDHYAKPAENFPTVVMVNHSGTVPQCATAFERLWLEAVAPEGAYTNFCAA